MSVCLSPIDMVIMYWQWPTIDMNIVYWLAFKSYRTEVNSYLSQLVPILVNSYPIFGQLVSFFGQLVPILVKSYLFWLTRPCFGQLVPFVQKGH